jgi:hypothetical protein
MFRDAVLVVRIWRVTYGVAPARSREDAVRARVKEVLIVAQTLCKMDRQERVRAKELGRIRGLLPNASDTVDDVSRVSRTRLADQRVGGAAAVTGVARPHREPTVGQVPGDHVAEHPAVAGNENRRRHQV